ncbi:hypothetical protein [Candidatus Uabimicrobium sp. HlEnr_7]|uniref:hypothetical protein n=1 Tax=Candidatus Uabimicrobium helgolandensis TaxID=3095367 RepID=UPI003557F992
MRYRNTFSEEALKIIIWIYCFYSLILCSRQLFDSLNLPKNEGKNGVVKFYCWVFFFAISIAFISASNDYSFFKTIIMYLMFSSTAFFFPIGIISLVILFSKKGGNISKGYQFSIVFISILFCIGGALPFLFTLIYLFDPHSLSTGP